MDPIFVRPGEGEYVSRSAARDVAILSDLPQLTVTFSRYAAGEPGPDPHVHRRHVDAFYILAGAMTYRVGREDRAVVAEPGTFVLVPPGVVHTFANESDGEVSWLNFHAPDVGFAQFLRDGSGWDSFDPPPDGGLPADDAAVARPGEGELFERANRALLIKAQVDELSAIEIGFDSSFHVEPHTHSDHTDSFWVLEGEVAFTVGEKRVVAEPGTFLAAPPGARHGFAFGSGDPRPKFLNVHGPDAGFADTIRGHQNR